MSLPPGLRSLADHIKHHVRPSTAPQMPATPLQSRRRNRITGHELRSTGCRNGAYSLDADTPGHVVFQNPPGVNYERAMPELLQDEAAPLRYQHPPQVAHQPSPRRPTSQPLGPQVWMHGCTNPGPGPALHLPRSRSQQSTPLQHIPAPSLTNSESSHSSLDLPVAVVRSARSCSCPSCGGALIRPCATISAGDSGTGVGANDEVFFTQTPQSCPALSWQQQHASEILSRMEAAWRDGGRLTDVVLLVDEERIPAHRVVLAAASDYFSAMFNCELVESSQREIRITDVDPGALHSLVEYMYTGELTIHEDTVESLLSAACLTQMWRVREICCDFLIRQLAASNCLGIRSFAECYGCSDLAERSTQFALEHFPEVLHHFEWRQLQVDEAASLLRSDDLNVQSEVNVFQACVDWCDGDQERRKMFPKLLSAVRLPLLPQSFLLEKVRPNAMIQESLEAMRLLLDALSIHLRDPDLSTSTCRARKSQLGRIWALGGINARHEGTQEMVEYDPRTERWSIVGHLPERRLQFGSAVVGDGALMVVGGRDGLKSLNTALLLAPGKREWLQLSPMATHRHGLGVGVLQGIVYAVGGHDGWSYLNTVERWDPNSRTWAYVSPMSMPRSTVGVAALSGRLYAVGGRDGSSCLRTVEAFDPHTQRWSLCSPLLKRRGGVGVAATGGCLYAVGGHDAPANNPIARRFDCAERYDPKTDQWTMIASLNSPRESIGLAVLGHRLFALGGCRGQKYSRTVEVLDPDTNKWTQTTELPSPLAGISVVVIKPLIQPS